MEIRRATEEDVTGMQWVARMTHRQVYDDLLNDETRERRFERRFSEAALEEWLTDNAVGVYVAVARDSIAGFATVGPTDDEGTGELMSLQVDPGFWRQGIGSALLEAAEGFLDTQGYDRMRAFVIAGNTRGNEFFRSRFEKAGQWQSGDRVTYNIYERPVRRPGADTTDSSVGTSWT